MASVRGLPRRMAPNAKLESGGRRPVFDLAGAQLGIEALIVPVFPGTARLDIERLYADPAEPGTHRLGGELRTVIRADMFWRAMDGEQIRQAVKDVIRVQLAGDDDRQTPARELINDRQQAEGRPSCVRSCTKS